MATEQEAAVRWLEKDYDKKLELVTRDTEVDGQPATHFISRFTWSQRGHMFTIKQQNG